MKLSELNELLKRIAVLEEMYNNADSKENAKELAEQIFELGETSLCEYQCATSEDNTDEDT